MKTDHDITARRALMALGTSAARKRNGLCAARFAVVHHWGKTFERVHVVHSAYTPLGER